MYLLQQARSSGVQFLQERVEDISIARNHIESLTLSNGTRVLPKVFINAAGPYINEIGRMMGIELPVFCELHHKVSIKDHLNIIPRNAPFLIWMDPQRLVWSQEERAEKSR